MNAANQGACACYLGEHRLDAIVIGGSAGAIDVLRRLLSGLPPRIGIPVIVVVHLPSDVPAIIHQVLQPTTPLIAKQVEDKEIISGDTLYFAPPGYHLLVEADGHFALSVDEPVHFSRPAIDVLFETASDAYAERLLGILLTGASQDGAAGMQTIHQQGGLTMVQSPESAEAVVMPASSIARFDPTYIGSPERLRAVLASIQVHDTQGAG